MKITVQQTILFLTLICSPLMLKLYSYIFGQQASLMQILLIIPIGSVIIGIVVGLIVGIIQAICTVFKIKFPNIFKKK